MELKEAYSYVKAALPKDSHRYAEIATARLCQLVEEINKTYRRGREDTEALEFALMGPAMAVVSEEHLRNLMGQRELLCRRLEQLGAWVDDEPIERCAKCGRDPLDQCSVRFVLWSEHVGGKREHLVCPACFQEAMAFVETHRPEYEKYLGGARPQRVFIIPYWQDRAIREFLGDAVQYGKWYPYEKPRIPPIG